MISESELSQSVQDDNLVATQKLVSSVQQKVIGVVRIILGVAWAVAALLKWQPAFITSFHDTVSGALAGQPLPIHAWIALWAGLVQTSPTLFGYLAAITESLLAICFILGIFTNAACVLGIGWSFIVWSVPEGFGGPFVSGQSTDIGTAFPYILLCALMLVLHAGLYFGLDQRLTASLGRYGFLASGSWRKSQRTS